MGTLPLFGTLLQGEDPRSDAELREQAERSERGRKPPEPGAAPDAAVAGAGPVAAPISQRPETNAPRRKPAAKSSPSSASSSSSAVPPAEVKAQPAERQERVYRVSQLNRAVRGLLEDRFQSVWVEGELSDVSRAASGHVYATLNDEAEPAQIRVVIFKNDARRSKAKLENGARVKLQGQLSLFTPRGSYQFIARLAVPYGLGELHAIFERTRKVLDAEGLLAPERKRPLPKLPRVLGVVTSQHGAALHDIIRVAHGRCPVRIVLSPCLVQGADAPASILAALSLVQRLPELDLVIIGRGGGAAEDLIAFNDERVARAIAACRVPIVSAVGHEVDVSIADLVADLRAATPSNAAELCVPERRVLSSALREQERALSRALEVRLGQERLRIERLSQHLRDPRRALHAVRARIDAERARLLRTEGARRRRERLALQTLCERLQRLDPRLLLAQRRAHLVRLRARLSASAVPLILQRKGRMAELAGRLDALSPLGILSRGYAIALHEHTGKALLRAGDAAPGDVVHVRLHEGTLHTRVLDPGAARSSTKAPKS